MVNSGIKLLTCNNNFFEKENEIKKKVSKFVLQPICSEKKSNWISMPLSVVNLKENFDVIRRFLN